MWRNDLTVLFNIYVTNLLWFLYVLYRKAHFIPPISVFCWLAFALILKNISTVKVSVASEKSPRSLSFFFLFWRGIYLSYECHLWTFCYTDCETGVSVCMCGFFLRQKKVGAHFHLISFPLPLIHRLSSHAIRSITMIIGFGRMHYCCCLSEVGLVMSRFTPLPPWVTGWSPGSFRRSLC